MCAVVLTHAAQIVYPFPLIKHFAGGVRESTMIAPFDIYRVDPKDGALLWCETAESLESAKHRVQVLGATHRTQFVVVSTKTGHRLTIDPLNPDHAAPEQA